MFLIRHLELAVVLVAVGEGEGDYVASRVGDVEHHAVGRWGADEVHRQACGGGDVDGDLAKVLGEGHREEMAVDGGNDGVGFGFLMNSSFHNANNTVAIQTFHAFDMVSWDQNEKDEN